MNAIRKLKEPEMSDEDVEEAIRAELSSTLHSVESIEAREKLLAGKMQAEALKNHLETLNRRAKNNIDLIEQTIAAQKAAHDQFIEKAEAFLEDQYIVRDITDKAITD